MVNISVMVPDYLKVSYVMAQLADNTLPLQLVSGLMTNPYSP